MSNQGVDLGCLALQDPWCNFNNLKPKFEGKKITCRMEIEYWTTSESLT